ncbi:hypothetical protein AB0G00_32700 [Nocardia salmonicida]|uniref:hypothetical protein n=1 Tax=Nocardia salmonicida TaxID=53431 RepID=UPI0033F45A92
MSQHTATTVDSADTVAVRWPEPSPLDAWWTEIMDGVPPRTRKTPGEDPHHMATPSSCRRRA